MTEPRRIEPVVFLHGMADKPTQPSESKSFHDYYRRETPAEQIAAGDDRLAFREYQQGGVTTQVPPEERPEVMAEHPASFPDSDIPEV